MSNEPVPRRYRLGISSIPPVDEADDERPVEVEHEDEEPPEL